MYVFEIVYKLSDLCSSRVWVRILVVTLVPLSKAPNFKCFVKNIGMYCILLYQQGSWWMSFDLVALT